MTAASQAEQPKRRQLGFAGLMVVQFAVMTGVGFLLQHFGFHKSTRSSFSFAVSIAMIIVAYQLGLHEGRNENYRRTAGSPPPPKQRG